MVICAHPDDEIIGLGGAILKFKGEGYNIVNIFFSYGEKSHPHLKEEIIAKTRKEETKRIDKIIGRKSIFFGLTEGRIREEVKEKKIDEKLKDLIVKHKPEKIFTLSSLDPHPDHRAVNNITLEIIEKIKRKNEVYSFEVWNIVKEDHPIMYVDIDNYFKEKMNLVKEFKSQWLWVYLQLLPLYIRARLYGRKCGCKYAEKFYRLR